MLAVALQVKLNSTSLWAIVRPVGGDEMSTAVGIVASQGSLHWSKQRPHSAHTENTKMWYDVLPPATVSGTVVAEEP